MPTKRTEEEKSVVVVMYVREVTWKRQWGIQRASINEEKSSSQTKS